MAESQQLQMNGPMDRRSVSLKADLSLSTLLTAMIRTTRSHIQGTLVNIGKLRAGYVCGAPLCAS